MTVTQETILEDIQLLVIKDSIENGLDDESIDELKTGLDSLINLNINNVFEIITPETLKTLNKVQLSRYTHIICNSIDIPHFKLISNELMIPVISQDWLKDVIKSKKILPLRPYSLDPRNIFKKLTISSSIAWKNDDKNILKCITRSFGGVFLSDLRRSITHFISDDLKDDSTNLIMSFNESNNEDERDIYIVTSDWIFDSIFSGELLPEKDYLLTNGKKTLKYVKVPDYLKSISFKFSENLDISSTMLNNLLKYFTENDKNYKKIYLTNEINPEIPNQVNQRTFDYLFALVFNSTSELSSDSLLYYPVNREKVKGHGKIVVAVTNYTGDSRLYIEQLVERMGCTFTKSLKTLNTHLVSSKKIGKKVAFAKKWKIKTVNHCWVEDCFMNWKILDEIKYSKLPRDSDNFRTIGDVEFKGFDCERFEEVQNRKVVETEPVKKEEDKHEVENTDENKCKPVESPGVVDDATNNLTGKPPSLNELISTKEPKEVRKLESTSNASTTSKSKTITITEIEAKNNQDETQEISDDTLKSKPKVNFESKSIPKTDINNSVKNKPKLPNNKRKATEIEEAEETEKPRKKEAIKTSHNTGKPYNIRAIVTGFDGTLSTGDKRELKKIGIIILESPNKSLNCIIAPSLLRTQKFLTALSFDPEYILEPLFLSDVLGTLDSVNKIGDFESIAPKINNYNIWKHVDFEKDIEPKKLFHRGATKDEAIEYLKQSRNNLFDGFVFNLSSGLNGGFDVIKPILKSFKCKQCNKFKDTSKTVAINTTRKVNNISDVAILVCGVGENNIQKQFVKVCEGSSTKYVILEWDTLICAIFEAGLTVTKENVLQQKGVCV